MTEVISVKSEIDERIVKPRNTKTKYLKIVAITGGRALTEDGEYLTEKEVTLALKTMSPTAFATDNGGDLMARFQNHWRPIEPLWNSRGVPTENDIHNEQGIRKATIVTFAVSWFGFNAVNQHTPGVRHIALDPVTFYKRSLDDIWPGPESPIERLLKWAITLRNWTYENQLQLSPTNGAIGSQLLRDRRFYPNPRRKVPKVVNERIRDNLPGNYYKLFIPNDSEPQSAIYLDQTRAHHYHAQRIQLPHANCLFARGEFYPLGRDISFMPRRDCHGLYYLRYRTPNDSRRLVFSPFGDSEKPATEYCGFLYSNEIELLRDLGYSILGAIAFWGATKLDKGINAIAKWSNEQLDKYIAPVWLKPILLSAYGVLAVRPKPSLALYGRAKAGEKTYVVTGTETLTGYLVGNVKGRKVEPGFANVLHRGMIEAATRAESLGFAQYLTAKGHKVLQIYADAVIIENDPDKYLPLIPPPWRIHSELTHYKPIHTQAFVSGEMERLPGLTGQQRQKISRGIGGAGKYDRVRHSTQWKAVKING